MNFHFSLIKICMPHATILFLSQGEDQFNVIQLFTPVGNDECQILRLHVYTYCLNSKTVQSEAHRFSSQDSRLLFIASCVFTYGYYCTDFIICVNFENCIYECIIDGFE